MQCKEESNFVDLTNSPPITPTYGYFVDLTENNETENGVNVTERCKKYSNIPDSSDEESEEKYEGTDDFYYNNPQWPVWSRESDGMQCTHLLEIILHDAYQHQDKICRRRPVGVRHNTVFVISLDSVDLKNITSDDNGAWEISTPRRMYHVKRSDSTGEVLTVERASETGNGVFTLIRQYGTHKATKREKNVEFKRVLSTLKDSNGNVLPIAILQYYFKGGKEEDLVHAAHGNARGANKRPYVRTMPSTLHSIKEQCMIKKPSKLYADKFESSGGLLDSVSASSEPRNSKQVYNARASRHNQNGEKDEVFQLLTQLKEDYAGDGGFIQEVKFGQTPQVILAFGQQLNDLVRFCTNGARFSIMGIDPTFNLGNFFVTLTTYKHLMLKHKRTNEHPVFIGPALIHMQQDTQTYYGFLSHLVGKSEKNALKDLKAYGSDGEVPLINALLAAFPDAIALRCFLHMKENVEGQLHNKFHVQPEVKSTIIHDIFGHVVGDTKVLGFTDASSCSDFDDRLTHLKDKWDHIAPGVHQWFIKSKAEIFKNNMIASVRESAQLGEPPKPYTTNANESKNFVVKDWVDFKKNTIPQFIAELRKYVNKSLVEGERAVYGSGEYYLAEDFKNLEVDSAEWHRWSAEQRTAHLKKFREAAMRNPYSPAAVVPKHMAVTPLHQHALTVLVVDAQLPGIPEPTMVGIWSKAAGIIIKKDSIVKAPGSQDSWLVESKSAKRPHLVSKEKNGRFKCDDGCRMWLSTRICSHTVAVAESVKLLPSFVDWLKKSKGTSANLAGMVLSDTPKGSGRKGGKPARRYGPARAKEAVQHHIDPMETGRSSPFDVHPGSASSLTESGFSLKWITRRISVCQGKCSRPMRDENGRIFPAPYDLCIARRERHFFISPMDGKKQLGRESPSHYHLKRSCLENADPPYRGECLHIPPEVDIRLSRAHRDTIHKEFGQ